MCKQFHCFIETIIQRKTGKDGWSLQVNRNSKFWNQIQVKVFLKIRCSNYIPRPVGGVYLFWPGSAFAISVCRWSLFSGDLVRLFMPDLEVKKGNIFSTFLQNVNFHPQVVGFSALKKKMAGRAIHAK